MACNIEQDKPVFEMRDGNPSLRCLWWQEIGISTKTNVVILKTIAGRVIFSTGELIFGEYEPEIEPSILNRQLRENVGDYSSFQTGVLQDPIFN